MNFQSLIPIAKMTLLSLALLTIGACQTKYSGSNPPSLDDQAFAESSSQKHPMNSTPLVVVKLDKTKRIDRIAFGSCAHQKQPQPIWTAIEKNNPQIYLSLGDTVYASKKEDQPIYTAYEMQSQHPDFQKIRNTVPIIGAWDDHDFGEGDGGKTNPLFQEARDLYTFNMINDSPEIDPKIKGNYHSFYLGPDEKNQEAKSQSPKKSRINKKTNENQKVQIIILDTRTYRDELEKNKNPKNELDIYQPTQDISKTFLGEDQWKWLDQELQKPARIRIIASSLQFVADEHGFEKWANFPHERNRLEQLLLKNKIKNFFILSGDRHAGEFSQKITPEGLKIWDITASGINRTSTLANEPNRFRKGPQYLQVNFGLMDIDWTQKIITVSLKNKDNEIIHQIKEKF